MLRGYYTAANGIINEQRILNVITNNMANAKTAGYKAICLFLPHLLKKCFL